MPTTIASDLQSAPLGEALARRGMALAPIAGALDPHWGAMLLRGRRAGACPRRLVGGVRDRGWRGPLMLLVGGGVSIADALDAGADEAAACDAAPAEIAARLAARLRERDDVLRLGDLSINRARRSASRAGQPLGLLPREYAILCHLADRAGTAVDRGALLSAIWRLDFDPGTNVVAVHVSRLRARLHAGGLAPILHTDRGKGYRLAPV